MDFLKSRKDSNVWRFRWHTLFALLVIVILLLTFIGWLTDQKYEKFGVFILTLSVIMTYVAVALTVFAGLLLGREAVRKLETSGEKLDTITELLSRQSTLLTGISQGMRLSDTAKEIVFRDGEQMELGEAVLNKLHQHDFEDTDAMIAAMAEQPKYRQLAGRLKRMADKYRNATEEGRVAQIVTHIEDLMDQFLWAQAAVQIDNLIKTFPYSEKAKTMHARLQERKNWHKRELLAEWDQAVRDKDTDRGLEILKELDLYLTPAEALALQESAATVFRTKLHNLGVEFSVAVAEKNWKKASDTGRVIVQNFPNSRMAAEIRSKMDILQERAGQSKE